jgi:CRISPR system Cascade subunit CasE
MYLSQITLATRDPRRVAALIGADAYRTHQTCWKLFHGADKRSFLYRRQPNGFITLCDQEPVDPDGIWHVESKSFAPKLREGDRLQFMVTANATVCKDGKRHDVMMNAKRCGNDPQEAARQWMIRRGEQYGFEAPLVRVGAHEQHMIRKPGNKIQFSTIDYDGVFKVIDPDRFIAALTQGIGRAKSFGCGLILIRRWPINA